MSLVTEILLVTAIAVSSTPETDVVPIAVSSATATSTAIAAPAAVATGSAAATFKAKLFWMMGPQAIGGFIGFMAFQSFMSNILGYAV